MGTRYGPPRRVNGRSFNRRKWEKPDRQNPRRHQRRCTDTGRARSPCVENVDVEPEQARPRVGRGGEKPLGEANCMLPSLRDRNFFHDPPSSCVVSRVLVAREAKRHGFPRTEAARCEADCRQIRRE